MLLIQRARLTKCHDCEIYRNKYNFLRDGDYRAVCNDCNDIRCKHDNDMCPVCYTDYTDSCKVGLIEIKQLKDCSCMHYICEDCFKSAFKDHYFNGDYDRIKCPLCRYDWSDLCEYIFDSDSESEDDENNDYDEIKELYNDFRDIMDRGRLERNLNLIRIFSYRH